MLNIIYLFFSFHFDLNIVRFEYEHTFSIEERRQSVCVLCLVSCNIGSYVTRDTIAVNYSTNIGKDTLMVHLCVFIIILGGWSSVVVRWMCVSLSKGN